jgi:hypothetical protein
VILRRLIPDALELVATNADHWHPDFVMKLWIAFHPQLAPAPSRQVFIMLAQETEPCGSVRSTRSLKHHPRRSLPSNLSQLEIGRRANEKPWPIAGRGCVGSDTKLVIQLTADSVLVVASAVL